VKYLREFYEFVVRPNLLYTFDGAPHGPLGIRVQMSKSTTAKPKPVPPVALIISFKQRKVDIANNNALNEAAGEKFTPVGQQFYAFNRCSQRTEAGKELSRVVRLMTVDMTQLVVRFNTAACIIFMVLMNSKDTDFLRASQLNNAHHIIIIIIFFFFFFFFFINLGFNNIWSLMYHFLE